MSDLVDPAQIEGIVGARRHPRAHIARAVTAKGTVFVLHSESCLSEFGGDLRCCPFSRALDRGIDTGCASMWRRRWRDQAVVVRISLAETLVPAGLVPVRWLL